MIARRCPWPGGRLEVKALMFSAAATSGLVAVGWHFVPMVALPW